MNDISREYAEALFMIAEENGKVEDYFDKLLLIKKVTAENPDYLLLLDSPAIPRSKRLATIDEAFSEDFPEYIISFLKLLCENGRIMYLSDCIKEFEELKDLADNRAKATVYSVVPLDESQKELLCKKLQKITGKFIDAEYIEDRSLLGGIKVEVDGKTLDNSIEKRLQTAKGVMIQ